MSRGLVLSAYLAGNDTIPYVELAALSACLARKQLGDDVEIYLVADEKAKAKLLETDYSGLFDIIDVDFESQVPNARQYAGTGGRLQQFNNGSRSKLYNRVSYDEIILMDTDYLLYEDSLNQVWGSQVPIRINRHTTSARNARTQVSTRMGDLTIPVYWATVTYLKRSKEADNFITLVEYVKENYDWFSHVYRFERGLYRNDYAFSIAIHLLGGETGYCPSVESLPVDTLRFAWDDDQVVGFDQTGLWINAHDHKREYGLIKTTDQSIHVLNKPSLFDHLPAMIEMARQS